jgi:hypothetical protein
MYKLFAAALLVLILSCKKDSKNPPSEPTTSVEVKEAVSGLPISNASVALFETSYGGIGYKEYFSGTTNENGICEVPSKYFSNTSIDFNVVAEKYWPYFIPAQRSNKVTLQAEGWLKVQVNQPANPYPENSRIRMYAISKSTGYFDVLYEKESELTVGSSLAVRGFGNELNTLFWQVTDASNLILNQGELNDIDIPRLDTVDVSLTGY